MKWHIRIGSFHFAFFNDTKLSAVGIATKIHHLTHQYSTAPPSNIAISNVFKIGIFGSCILNIKNKP